jgi:hypothetical protein
VIFIFPFLSTLSIVHSCWLQIAYRLGKTKFSPQPQLQVSNQNLISLPLPKMYFTPLLNSSLIDINPFQNCDPLFIL